MIETAYILATVIDLPQIVGFVYDHGPAGVLLVWIWDVRKDLIATRKELNKSIHEHKADLKNHAEEVKSLIQGWQNKDS